jgi:flagellar M-ring protein FliF
VTTEAMRQETDRDSLAVGVPGSLSNRPVAVAASAPASDAATARKEATSRQYAYDRSITQIQRSRGRLARMNVAVVLNTAVAPGGSKTGWTRPSWPTSTRSCAAAWASTPSAATSSPSRRWPSRRGRPLPWWQERDTAAGRRELGQLGGGRPAAVLPGAPADPRQRRLLPATTGTDAADRAGAQRVPRHGPPPPAGKAEVPPRCPARPRRRDARGALLENYDLPPAGSPVDVLVDHLKTLAGKEPERVAEVVKQWMQKHAQPE